MDSVCYLTDWLDGYTEPERTLSERPTYWQSQNTFGSHLSLLALKEDLANSNDVRLYSYYLGWWWSFLGSRKVMFSPLVPQAPSYQEGPADPEKTMFQYKHNQYGDISDHHNSIFSWRWKMDYSMHSIWPNTNWRSSLSWRDRRPSDTSISLHNRHGKH